MDRQRPSPSVANAPVKSSSGVIAPGSRIVVPSQMRTVRHVPPKTVESRGGQAPLIHPKDPDERQIQAHYISEVRVFDLADPDDLDEYNKVWQDISDGRSLLSAEDVKFSELTGKFLAFMRWVDVEYALPGAPRPERRRGQDRAQPGKPVESDHTTG